MSAFTELRLATKPAKRWFPKISVPIGYKGLEYRNGELSRHLSPGEYRTRRGAGYTFVDVRERVMTLAPQDILTSDSVSLRVTMAVRATVVDAVAFTERASDPWASVYLAAQVALREVCAAVTVDEVITRADTVDTGPIIAATARAGQATGIEVLDVVVKDVILPAEIRSAATELVTAKARGLDQAGDRTRRNCCTAFVGQRRSRARRPPRTGTLASGAGCAVRHQVRAGDQRRRFRHRLSPGDRGQTCCRVADVFPRYVVVSRGHIPCAKVPTRHPGLREM